MCNQLKVALPQSSIRGYGLLLMVSSIWFDTAPTSITIKRTKSRHCLENEALTSASQRTYVSYYYILKQFDYGTVINNLILNPFFVAHLNF